MAIYSIGVIMVFTRPPPLHQSILHLNSTFHAATIYWMNHIKNGYCLITDVAAILDFARILYQLIGTKQLQMEKLLQGADIKSCISFHMATLNLTLAEISRFFYWPKCAKDGSYCPYIVQLDVHVLCNLMSIFVQLYVHVL